MPIPNVKDYARIQPPWVSIDTGRTPMLKWHASRGAAKVSAQDAAWGIRDLPLEDGAKYRAHEWYATRDHAIAVLEPNGDLRVVQVWREGQVGKA